MSASTVPVGVNTSRRPHFFCEDRAHVINTSTPGFSSSLKNEARMSEPIAAAAPAPILHKTAGGNAAYHNFNNDFAHIQDPNERRRLALAEIDKAPFGW